MVNQQLPILLSWCPKGFASGYALQISTNTAFSTVVIDEPYLIEARYTFSNAAPSTAYFWRVSTYNDAGVSDWATNAFSTVPPAIHVTSPNGGEAWQRGLNYFVQWNGNTPEPVVIDLYKSGVFLQTIATNANTGAYRWSLSYSLLPDLDYSIKVKSSTTGTLFDLSDATFSIIDAPAINAGSVIRLSTGQVQFALTAPGAAQVTVLGSTNLSNWQPLQTVPVTNGSAVFSDTTATNFPGRFYRLRVP